MSFSDPNKQREYDRQRKAKARAEQKAEQTEKKKPDARASAWTIIVYPESAPANWVDILNEYHTPWACSPLHDKDLSANGEPKKAHWHILINFGKVKKSFSQVSEIAKKLNAPTVKICHSIVGLVRYMTHRDDADKYQYDVQDIKAYCGFDLEDYLKPTTSECMAMQNEMIQWCFENGITDFWVLNIYALKKRPDWAMELNRSCFQICQFLKSLRHGADAKTFNEETGESFV